MVEREIDIQAQQMLLKLVWCWNLQRYRASREIAGEISPAILIYVRRLFGFALVIQVGCAKAVE